ncbi:jg25858 [Pararge aegeria aegeria]|uniref:Jg25858 protein n=1 Tax=Pararge aegeria aegeria TaxID=348720 RepID=A0A8S4RWW0_9NEOP|nr:jg25858 [Pararge aegeria aegeria]
MFKLIIVLFSWYLVNQVKSQLLPVIYAAPSAVSHQSRIDVKHTPGIITPSIIYSPTIYATYPLKVEKPREVVLRRMTGDTVLTPIALSFFHNLPLARALEHPVSINQDNESTESSTVAFDN